jgi:superfamily II DNA or RNA helicase
MFETLEVAEEYRSDRDNLIQDFYLPCLEESRVYSRAVGYFSSTVMIAVAKGLTGLIRSGGKMRLVASPCLSEEDIEAIEKGLKQRETVIIDNLSQELEQEFNAVAKDRLACLSWLLSQGVLEIKLAVPKNIKSLAIYHEKLGLFQDEFGNTIAFTGSANESYSALVENFECVDVFCSWKENEQERVKSKIKNFERLWNNETPNIDVIYFPEAAKRSLIKLCPPEPPQKEVKFQSKQKQRRVAERGGGYNITPEDSAKPQLNIELREIQTEAITTFNNANYRGILAMATGSGKTITALGCAVELEDVKLIVIGAPTKEIVQQWVEEIEQKTTFRSPLVAIGKAKLWLDPLFRKLRLINNDYFDTAKLPLIVIGIYSELAKLRVADLIDDAGGLPQPSLLIADEVHATGASESRRLLREDFSYRLGLSATPIRPYDEEGTEIVLEYFGNIVYEFSLESAIAANILCEYDYHVYVTSLDDEEHEAYQKLTAKIARLWNKDDDENKETITQLKIKRAKIIKEATSKLSCLDHIITDYPLKQTMVYCANIDQATEVSRKLAHQGFSVARYTSKEKDRQTILSDFAKGYLDAVVAVKCLDEGVDIPSVSQAIILASDTSERQFIQRRGRILRTAPKKTVATLIDILVVPPLEDQQVNLIQSEVDRVTHFAESARNRNTVINTLAKDLAHYGITHSDFL